MAPRRGPSRFKPRPPITHRYNLRSVRGGTSVPISLVSETLPIMDTSAASSAAPSPAIPLVPTNSTAPPATSGVLVVPSSQSLTTTVAPRRVLTPEEVTTSIVNLSHGVKELQDMMKAFLSGQYVVPPPQPSHPPHPPLPLPSSVSVPQITYPYGMPTDSMPSPSTSVQPSVSQVPIHMLQFPHSPSPIPAWALGSSAAHHSMTAPLYSSAPPRSTIPQAPSTVAHGGPYAAGILYGGVDGPLFHDTSASVAAYAAVPPGADQEGPYERPQQAMGGGLDRLPPKTHRLEFATYDGSEDPLNWLNHCEQFFRGQRWPASDRTWIASYHLRGLAQTWYYALEQDEGMPSWERFVELCRQRFGPPVRGTRLAELGRLPFQSTVQEFADRFQAVSCHARGVSAKQKADLFVGGLPEYIRVDVEMRDPQDIQTAMYLARAFERRAAAMPTAPPPRGARPPPRPGLPPRAPPPAAGAPAQPGAGPAGGQGAPPVRQFRRLTPAEQLERRRQGLCFNCDEPYVRGHVCPRLFYLESTDFVDEAAGEVPAAEADAAAFPDEPAGQGVAGDAADAANALVVSLHAVAGIRPPNAMLLSVTVKDESFLALLDTGSTHNFVQGAVLRRLGLSPAGGDHLRVTVANGEHVACEGIARNVPVRIGDEDFTITCVGLNLGAFDFIIGFDFIRTLGPVLWDCDALTMAFWREGRRVTWQGVPGPQTPSPQQPVTAVTTDPRLPLLDRLLAQHGDIFDEPTGLPPARPYDHRIHLLPGTAPVAVRPYRYPQLQKDELERQCAAMLA